MKAANVKADEEKRDAFVGEVARALALLKVNRPPEGITNLRMALARQIAPHVVRAIEAALAEQDACLYVGVGDPHNDALKAALKSLAGVG